jgi:hypothetical protein
MQQLWRARTRRGIDTIQKAFGKFYLIGPRHPDEPRSWYGVHQDSLDTLETVLRDFGGDGTHVGARFFSGDFYPRIWRGDESPAPDEAGVTAEWIATVRIARLLLGHLRNVCGYIEPVRGNDAVYGMEQRHLLILTCTEVESAWKSILTANAATPRRSGGRWTTEDYVRLLLPLRLNEWSVTLSAHPSYGAIAPFASWDSSRPTASLDWYDAYNAVKHDRENSLARATFERVSRSNGGLVHHDRCPIRYGASI